MESPLLKGRYSPQTFLFFWLFLLMAVVVVRWVVDDDYMFISIISAWTVLSFLGVLFHHSYLIGDKNWMAMPIAYFIPYWLVFYLIPARLVTQEGYALRTEHIIASEYWPAVVFAASIGICSFFGGFVLIARKITRQQCTFQKAPGDREIRVMRMSAWILLFIALAGFSLFIASGGTGLYRGGYVHVQHLGWSARMAYIVFETAFRAAVGIWAIYLLMYRRLRWSHLIPLTGLGAMLFAVILSGDRYLLAWSGICVLVVYSQRYSIRLHHMLLFLLIGSIAFSAIQKARTVNERSIDAYVSAITEDFDPMEGLTQYAENIAPTVTNAFAAVEQDGHFHGTFFIQGVLSIIPFYGKFFYWLPATQNKSMYGTGYYVTNYVFGDHPYQLATTVITDIYIDFGLFGVLVAMFCYGCLGGYLYNLRCQGKNNFGLFCYAIFMPAFMYSTRAGITSSFRLLWSLALCYCIFIIVSNLLKMTQSRKNRQNS